MRARLRSTRSSLGFGMSGRDDNYLGHALPCGGGLEAIAPSTYKFQTIEAHHKRVNENSLLTINVLRDDPYA
jgi:hypothetical protein